jgi:hypothetical protein
MGCKEKTRGHQGQLRLTVVMRRGCEGKTKGNKGRKQEVTKKRENLQSPFLK